MLSVVGVVPDKSLRHYCTCFDRFFLHRALALHSSLVEHGNKFVLYAFCHDQESFRFLTEKPHENIIPISIEQVEYVDAALHAARSNRSRIEFYFTCTPALCLYVLDTYPDVDLITYIDADLYFYSNPEPLYKEFADNSIGIIEHKYAFGARRLSKYGKYNVGWLMFRRDAQGIACLRRWRERCIEWCYDRFENGKFADQKYLEEWPQRFRGVIPLKHKGANVAGWNIRNYVVTKKNDGVYIDDEPLIFFHFAGFREVRQHLFMAGLSGYYIKPGAVVKRFIIEQYVKALLSHASGLVGKRIRKTEPYMPTLKKFIRSTMRILRGILFGDYILYYRGRIW